MERLVLYIKFEQTPRPISTVVTLALPLGDQRSLLLDQTVSVRDVSFDISEQLVTGAEFVLLFDQVSPQAQSSIWVGLYPEPFPEMPDVFPRNEAVHYRAS